MTGFDETDLLSKKFFLGSLSNFDGLMRTSEYNVIVHHFAITTSLLAKG